MHPTQALRRPLTARIMQGAAGRYTRFPNKLHSRGIITLKDHLVSGHILSLLRMHRSHELTRFL